MDLPRCHLIVPGAQKAATTWLRHVLAGSDQFYYPAGAGEIHFFDQLHERGETYYLQLYADCPADRVSFDVTPNYLDCASVPERIWRIAPKLGRPIKIAVLLREPVSRLFSAYQMNVREGHRTEPLREQVEKYGSNLLEKGLYYKHLRHWGQIFPSESFLYLLTDELRANRQAFLQRLAAFVDVEGAIENPFVQREFNLGGLQRSRLVDTLFKAGGEFLRRRKATDLLKRLKGNPVIASIRSLNRKPYQTTEEEDRILSELRTYFAEDVLALAHYIGRPDLPEIWGYRHYTERSGRRVT